MKIIKPTRPKKCDGGCGRIMKNRGKRCQECIMKKSALKNRRPKKIKVSFYSRIKK